MMRSLTIVLLVVSAGVLAYLLFQDEADASFEQQNDPGAERPVAGDPTPRDRTPADDAGIATVPFENEPPGDDTPSRFLDVIVLESAPRRPVAGAEVTSCDTRTLWRILREKDVVHGTPEGRRIMRDMSTAAITAADGTARLAVAGRMMLIQARSEGLWGMRLLTSIPDEPVEILLVEDQLLRVRVVSPTGDPLNGVPIALRRKISEQPTWSHKITATEPPDGIGTFEHMQRRFDQGDGWHATFAFPLLKQPGLPVSRDSISQDPLTLSLPGAGGLEILVRDENGMIVGGNAMRVEVRAFPFRDSEDPIWQGGPWSKPRLGRSGRARVPWLGLGLHLQVTAESADPYSERRPVQVELAGPKLDGEIVECRIVVKSEPDPSERFPTIVGRFVRKDGSPCSAAEVYAYPRIHPLPPMSVRGKEITLDKEGRFRFLLRHACPEGGTLKYRFHERGDGPRSGARASVDLSRHLPPGETDLGDIVLDYGSLLVSGHIVDESGNPVAGAQFQLSSPVTRSGRVFWPSVTSSGPLNSAADGSFALYSARTEDVRADRMRFHAWHRDFLYAPDEEISAGTRDLRYVLQRAGALEGSIRLLPGQDARDFRITLHQAGAKKDVGVDSSGSFEGTRLRPGTLKLILSLKTGSRSRADDPTMTVDDIDIVAGSINRDPRIQGIQLAGRAKKVVLHVVDKAATPIYRACVALAGKRYPTPWYSNQDGVVTVHVDDLPADLTVRAYGYRSVTVKAVRDRRSVVLERGFPVRIVTNAKVVGREPSYVMTIMPYVLDEGTGRQDHVLHNARPPRGVYFDGEGSLRMVLPEPGTYVFRPLLIATGRVASGGSIKLTPEPTFMVREVEDEQVFQLDIAQELVDKALTEALK